jgi:hypothetical protein
MEVFILNYLFIGLVGFGLGGCIGATVTMCEKEKEVEHAFNEGYKCGYDHGFTNRMVEGHDEYYRKYYVRRKNDEKAD